MCDRLTYGVTIGTRISLVAPSCYCDGCNHLDDLFVTHGIVHGLGTDPIHEMDGHSGSIAVGRIVDAVSLPDASGRQSRTQKPVSVTLIEITAQPGF